MTTQVSRLIAAPRARVYEALLNPQDVAQWRFPSGMTCEIHHFEPFEGGTVRISLTHVSEGGVGKTTGRTDTYGGRFVRIVPNELVVEVDQFETSDPALAGEMTMTIRLGDAQDGSTLLSASHEGLPAGLSSPDNEAGWNDALARLAKLVETSDCGRQGSAP